MEVIEQDFSAEQLIRAFEVLPKPTSLEIILMRESLSVKQVSEALEKSGCGLGLIYNYAEGYTFGSAIKVEPVSVDTKENFMRLARNVVLGEGGQIGICFGKISWRIHDEGEVTYFGSKFHITNYRDSAEGPIKYAKMIADAVNNKEELFVDVTIKIKDV